MKRSKIIFSLLTFFFGLFNGRADDDKSHIEGLRLDLSFPKQAYPAGGLVVCNVRLTNLGVPALLNFDHERSELEIRNIKVGERIKSYKHPYLDKRYPLKSATVDSKAWKEWHLFINDFANLEEGDYILTFRQYFNGPVEKRLDRIAAPAQFIEAKTTLHIIDSGQHVNSKAEPSIDLKIALFDRSQEGGKPNRAPVISFTTRNVGSEPWFYRALSYQHGIRLEVVDSKGKAISLNSGGETLARKWNGNGRVNNWTTFDLLPGDTATSPHYVIDHYAPLEAGQHYKVRVVWSSEAYRSLKERNNNQNPIAFEVRSDLISIFHP